MSSPISNSNAAPVRDARELTAYLAGGMRAPEDWKIGTEHEKFGFTWDDLTLRPAQVARDLSRALTPTI